MPVTEALAAEPTSLDRAASIKRAKRKRYKANVKARKVAERAAMVAAQDGVA